MAEVCPIRWRGVDFPNLIEALHTSIRILWHADYHDGPLSGMCLFMGDKHWFVCVGQDPGGLWTYILFKLTSEQIRIEEDRKSVV